MRKNGDSRMRRMRQQKCISSERSEDAEFELCLSPLTETKTGMRMCRMKVIVAATVW
jgi:hypothetical protein